MASNKTRKCQYCTLNDTLMEEMELVMSGGKTPKKLFFHKGDCYESYKKEKAFKEKELKELDDLRLAIQKIYGVDPLPQRAYAFLQKIRNGVPYTGKLENFNKRYKEGYSYPLIQETYEYCSDTIEEANSRKNFSGFLSAFLYGLAIIVDKIYIVEQRVAQREKAREKMDKHIENINAEDTVYETSYKKPSKKQKNLSDFLDD